MHRRSTAPALSYLQMDIQGHFMPTVWHPLSLWSSRAKTRIRVFVFSCSAAAEPAEYLVCSLRTYLAQTQGWFFFFHSCNHLFVSFASSAQGKLLSWQHLSLRIIQAATGANSAKGFQLPGNICAHFTASSRYITTCKLTEKSVLRTASVKYAHEGKFLSACTVAYAAQSVGSRVMTHI